MPARRHVGLAAAIVSSTVLGTALPAFVAHADSTTLHVNNSVSANCSDSGTGTQAQPYCTVQAAANAAQPGQTVQIASGSYPEQVTVTHSGTQGSPIVFRGGQNYAQASGMIGVGSGSADAQSMPHAFVLSGVHDVTVTGLSLQAPQEAVLVSGSDRVTVDGNSLQAVGSGNPGVRLAGKTTASTVSRNYLSGSGIAVDGGVTGAVVTTNLISTQGVGITVTDAPGTAVTSNSVFAKCGTSIAIAGNSANSTVENNIASSLNVGCSDVPDLTVSAASTSGTRVDYNLVRGGAVRVHYAWGDATYTSPAAFSAATGQGGHDIAGAGTSVHFNMPAAIDSADAAAPGELAADILGNPRVDDPQVPNTGTGAGYYDRGATELQDPLTANLTVSALPQPGRPLDAGVSVSASSPWSAVTGSLDFGDGSPKVPVNGSASMGHTYPTDGTYTVTLTVSDSAGTTHSFTQTVTIAPVGPLQPYLDSYEVDSSTPAVTFQPGATSPWPVVKFVLDFGDGSPKAEFAGPNWPASFAHPYPGAGTYTVTETVTDDHGRSATLSRDVKVVVARWDHTIEAVRNGLLTEIYDDVQGVQQVNAISPQIQASALAFSYSPSRARVIEAIEGGALHEIYSAADGWHDGVIAGAGANTSALSFSYSPSGARVIEAIEGGVLHEIYSAADGWHDNPIQGVAPNVSALSFTYNAAGQRVIEAIEGGVLHEIYSAADGWHDNPIQGVAPNVSTLSFTYNPQGQRVIEAVEGGVLHEVYSDTDGWHDNAVPGAGSNITSLSVKTEPNGVREIAAVEGTMLHSIQTWNGWNDAPVYVNGVTAVSMDMR